MIGYREDPSIVHDYYADLYGSLWEAGAPFTRDLLRSYGLLPEWHGLLEGDSDEVILYSRAFPS